MFDRGYTMKTEQVFLKGIRFDVLYKVNDTSFDHEFGTKNQSQKDIYSVSIKNIDITDIIQQSVLDDIYEELNKFDNL